MSGPNPENKSAEPGDGPYPDRQVRLEHRVEQDQIQDQLQEKEEQIEALREHLDSKIRDLEDLKELESGNVDLETVLAEKNTGTQGIF